MKRVGKNSIALGLVLALITLALSFSANGAEKPVAQAQASAVKGTGLFNILDGGSCEVVYPKGEPTGRCGEGLNTPSIDAYSQEATAGLDGKTKNGVSSAKASVAPIDAIDLHTTLDLTDVIDGLAAIDTGSILDPLVGGVGGLLKTVIDTLKLAGIDVVGGIDDALQAALTGLDDALPVKLQVGAVEASASAKPGSAEGTSKVAGLNLLIDLGGQEIKVPLKADTAPNSPLLITAPQQLADDIIDGLMDTLSGSLGGALAPLNAVLGPLKDQLLGPLFDALEPTLLSALSDALEPIISGTVNVQTPVSPTDGEIDVTALHLTVLGDNTLDLARVHVGPNGISDADADANANADADANANADADADANAITDADAATNADTDAAADADANADAGVTSALPNTGAPNLIPLFLLALGLIGFGTAVLANEKRRLGKI